MIMARIIMLVSLLWIVVYLYCLVVTVVVFMIPIYWVPILFGASKNIPQWPFQEPKLEVPTIDKAYIRPM